MKHKGIKFNTAYTLRILILILILILISWSKNASAATIIFDPQESTVGIDTPFLLGLTLASERPINAISVIVDIPYPLSVVDFSDGDSIINFWTIRPHINDAGKLEFAGIIPGGFVGKGSRLLTMSVKAPQAGRSRIDLHWTSKAYLNSEGSPEEILSAKPITITAIKGKDNLTNTIDDVDSPEAFSPEIVVPGSEANQPWVVIFSTVDKGSGIASYEVAESYSFFDAEVAADTNKLSWREAESPHVLSDQQLHSYVYVKAVDKNGNSVVGIATPRYPLPWYRSLSWYIIMALLVVFVVYRALYGKLKKRRT